MRNRIDQAFSRARAEHRPALLAYVMAGDPDLETSLAVAAACAEAGADLIELGMPFSDPIADGPTIQAAAGRSLAAGTTLRKGLALGARLRERISAPIVLMGYLNPVLALGEGVFAAGCVAAGVDGVILADLPFDEPGALRDKLGAAGVRMIRMAAPSSPPARLAELARGAEGFVYAVSVSGVTGARARLPAELGARLGALRSMARVPVAVGFGVSTAAQVRELGALADGVVVGSALVARVAEGPRELAPARARAFIASLLAPESTLDYFHLS